MWFCHQLTKDQYVVDLWKTDLELQLMYVTVVENNTSIQSPTLDVGYIAPSWSWVSVEELVVLKSIFLGVAWKSMLYLLAATILAKSERLHCVLYVAS